MKNNPTQGQQIGLGTAIKTALPDKRLIKLTDNQIASLKKASDLALAAVGTAGVIAIAVLAPNLFQAIPRLTGKRRLARKHDYQSKLKKVENTFYYLKRSGLVHFRKPGKEWLLSLTTAGHKRFAKLELLSLHIRRGGKWDGHWWLVAADVPTRQHRAGADLLRRKLKQLEFYSLQRTLWLYPFDPRKEVEFLCQNYDIARFVTVMEIARLDSQDERVLKNHFKAAGVL